MKNGDIDGYTLVYSHNTDGWKKVSEVPAMKAAMMKIAMEEDAINEALHAIDTSNQQELAFEQEVLPTMPDLSKKDKVKKSFTADDGKR
jgi:hypothetical protein